MDLLKPDFYYKNIYEIPYEKLKKRNIKCLLFDLDNTCIGYKEKEPTKKLTDLFNKLKKIGFEIIIFSNARKKRLEPFKKLPVICHPFSKKPLLVSFKKVMKKYLYQKEEICIIGDQLFTDVLGGNRAGITTCLVNPLTEEDFIITKFFRRQEKRIFNKIKKKGKEDTKIWKNV